MRALIGCCCFVLLLQSKIFATNPNEADILPQYSGPRLSDTDRVGLLHLAREVLETGGAKIQLANNDPTDCSLFLSLSRSNKTAIITEGNSNSLTKCIQMAAKGMRNRTTATERQKGKLKIDLVLSFSVEPVLKNNRIAIDPSLEGLAFSSGGFRWILLPEELLSRDLITTAGVLQVSALKTYLAESSRLFREVSIENSEPSYHAVRFDSFMEAANGGMVRLFRGNADPPPNSPESLMKASISGGEYLLKHQFADGKFEYNYDPQINRTDADYNILRHAGTCYALLQLYQVTGDARYLEGAKNGIEYLLTFASLPLEEHSYEQFEVIAEGSEAKLGGAALALLALAEYQNATHDTSWLDCARKLAAFLVFQQKPSGEFLSKYYYDQQENEPFESLYYPGESILALTRLFEIDRNPEWLFAAMRGADWLIMKRDGGKQTRDLPHDHWLLISLNELQRITGKRIYATHSFRTAQAILTAQRTVSQNHDLIGSFYDPPRSTPTAIRAEALVAVWQLATREGAPRAAYLRALERMSLFQLRCQFTDENILYLPRPDLAIGGFRQSLTNWDVRIDYVQHNISALLGLHSILIAQQNLSNSN